MMNWWLCALLPPSRQVEINVKHLKLVWADGLPSKKKNDKGIIVVNVEYNGEISSDESYRDNSEDGSYSEDEDYDKDENFINEDEIVMMDKIMEGYYGEMGGKAGKGNDKASEGNDKTTWKRSQTEKVQGKRLQTEKAQEKRPKIEKAQWKRPQTEKAQEKRHQTKKAQWKRSQTKKVQGKDLKVTEKWKKRLAHEMFKDDGPTHHELRDSSTGYDDSNVGKNHLLFLNIFFNIQKVITN